MARSATPRRPSGGGKQKGVRPLEFVGEELVRRLLSAALSALTPEERRDLFPAPGLGWWTRKLGLGTTQATDVLAGLRRLVDGGLTLEAYLEDAGAPAPPEAMTGMETAWEMDRVNSRS